MMASVACGDQAIPTPPTVPPPAPLQLDRVYRVGRALPESSTGGVVPKGTRLRLRDSVIVPRDLDRYLCFQNLATAESVALTEADPRLQDFFRQPGTFLALCDCAHSDLSAVGAERLAGMACAVMAEEYLLTWWRCTCGALVEEMQRDALAGLSRLVFERSLPEIEQRLALVRLCPDPADAHCSCPAHRAQRGGFG